ncbi:MAG: hypothetical protein AAF490_11285 [Chloroflexota bacterium]
MKNKRKFDWKIMLVAMLITTLLSWIISLATGLALVWVYTLPIGFMLGDAVTNWEHTTFKINA